MTGKELYTLIKQAIFTQELLPELDGVNYARAGEGITFMNSRPSDLEEDQRREELAALLNYRRSMMSRAMKKLRLAGPIKSIQFDKGYNIRDLPKIKSILDIKAETDPYTYQVPVMYMNPSIVSQLNFDDEDLNEEGL